MRARSLFETVLLLAALAMFSCSGRSVQETDSVVSVAAADDSSDVAQADRTPFDWTLCGDYDTAGMCLFVNVDDVVPDVELEIRYFDTFNFVGRRVDGYLEPAALLSRRAADSLRAVAIDLARQGYRLKVYDAYRPQCAVDCFVQWARRVDDTVTRRWFYPEIDKRQLFANDYIATRSGHTRGSTVDLTLIDASTGEEVDMGGTFDYMSTRSHPACGGNPATGRYRKNDTISEMQFRNRMTLRSAMLRHGFRPLYSEWWHFTLRNEPFADRYFNFPVVRLR